MTLSIRGRWAGKAPRLVRRLATRAARASGVASSAAASPDASTCSASSRPSRSWSAGRVSARRPKRWRCSSLIIRRRRSLSARSANTIALSRPGSSGSRCGVALTNRSESDLAHPGDRFDEPRRNQLGTTGAATCRTSCTRRQSSPSRSPESWAALSRRMPSCTFGQRNSPSSSRLANKHTPVPSQKIIFTRSARLARNTYTAPENGSAPIVSRTSAAKPRRHLCGSRLAGSLASRERHPSARSRTCLQSPDNGRDRLRARARPDPDRYPVDLELDPARRRATSPSSCARLGARCGLLVCRGGHHRRHERDSLLPSLLGPPRIPPPPEQLLRQKPMSASHLGHDSARSARLFNNAGLVVHRPPPTPAKAADDLDPPQRPTRLKPMVKSRHKTILHGPSDSTFTPRQRRWVPDHAYAEKVVLAVRFAPMQEPARNSWTP